MLPNITSILPLSLPRIPIHNNAPSQHTHSINSIAVPPPIGVTKHYLHSSAVPFSNPHTQQRHLVNLARRVINLARRVVNLARQVINLARSNATPSCGRVATADERWCRLWPLFGLEATSVFWRVWAYTTTSISLPALSGKLNYIQRTMCNELISGLTYDTSNCLFSNMLIVGREKKKCF